VGALSDPKLGELLISSKDEGRASKGEEDGDSFRSNAFGHKVDAATLVKDNIDVEIPRCTGSLAPSFLGGDTPRLSSNTALPLSDGVRDSPPSVMVNSGEML